MSEGMEKLSVLSLAHDVDGRAENLRTKLTNLSAFLEPRDQGKDCIPAGATPNNPASVLSDARRALIEADNLLDGIVGHLGVP